MSTQDVSLPSAEPANVAAELMRFASQCQQAMDTILRTVEAMFGPGTEGRQVLEQLQRFALELPRIQEKLGRFPAEVQLAFREAGFPPCRLMTLDDWDRIVNVHASGGKAAVTPLVEDMAREMLASGELRDRILNDWMSNPKTTKRVHILRDALDAHLRGAFNLSIPAVLAQLEGVVADGTGHKGRMNVQGYKTKVDNIVSGETILGPWVNEFIDATVLAAFEHGSSPNSDLSRHAILHGGDTNYGSERNSMRTIMLFDYVQHLVRPVPQP